MDPEVLTRIERHKPSLVGLAEAYLDSNKIYESRDKPAPGKKKRSTIAVSQLRNLLSAAQAQSSLAVLINLLRYQIGRGPRGWRHRESGEALAAMLHADIRPRAEEIAATPDSRYAVEARLAALFLGYLIREFTYRCVVEGTSYD